MGLTPIVAQEPNAISVYLEVSPTVVSGAYIQVNVKDFRLKTQFCACLL